MSNKDHKTELSKCQNQNHPVGASCSIDPECSPHLQSREGCCKWCKNAGGHKVLQCSCDCHTPQEKEAITTEQLEKAKKLLDSAVCFLCEKTIGMNDHECSPESTSTWEEELRLKVDFDKNEDREVCILIVQRLISEAHAEGKREAVEELKDKILKKARIVDYADRNEYDEAYDIITKLTPSK